MSQPRKVRCPKCGTDVMVTGFTLRSEVTQSLMRFHGRGAVVIATTEKAADRAECMVCGEPLEKTPVELMRIA